MNGEDYSYKKNEVELKFFAKKLEKHLVGN